MKLFPKKNNHALSGDLTVYELTESMKKTERAVEKLFLKHGFIAVTVKSAQNKSDIPCYCLGDVYCRIGFMKNYTDKKELKDWVLIEYAGSCHDAARRLFEDGDAVPLDLPLDNILFYLEKEITANMPPA